MSQSPHPDLIKVTEIFLIPSSFLVAALGTADTNLHRAAVSLIGLIIAVLWLICTREAVAEIPAPDPTPKRTGHPRRTRIMAWMPTIFVAAWLLSVVVHVAIANKKLGEV